MNRRGEPENASSEASSSGSTEADHHLDAHHPCQIQWGCPGNDINNNKRLLHDNIGKSSLWDYPARAGTVPIGSTQGPKRCSTDISLREAVGHETFS
jgi:hypothetical protein